MLPIKQKNLYFNIDSAVHRMVIHFDAEELNRISGAPAPINSLTSRVYGIDDELLRENLATPGVNFRMWHIMCFPACTKLIRNYFVIS